MNSKEKYENVVLYLHRQGYDQSVPADVIRQAIMTQFTIHQESALRFHIKNMEIFGMIRLVMPGVFEIVMSNP